jgi:IS30 family transposase
MPAKRELTMRQLRYMLRLHHDGVSAREIGRTLGVARSTIQDNLRRAHAIGEVSRPKFRQALRGASRPTAPLHAVAPFHISVGCGACHPESKNRMREICI